MKIAVDAMGGDFAPQKIVEGAFLAAKQHGVKVVLVGDEDQVSKELSKYPTSKLPIFIHHAPFVVAMHDSPSAVIRRMKDTSIKVAIDLAKGRPGKRGGLRRKFRGSHGFGNVYFEKIGRRGTTCHRNDPSHHEREHGPHRLGWQCGLQTGSSCSSLR